MTEAHSLDEERTWAESTSPRHAGSRGLRPGLVVSGRYRVGSLLGAGGMGLVYEAEHLTLGLPVALKVLRPELIDHQAMIARFQREARFTATLAGDHVVRVLDQGRLETGLPFFVMERLQGLDLRAVLQACSTLPVAVTSDYARQTCSALAEAHAAGIVHRDVKPSNLFVSAHASGHSRVKLLDFGVAQQHALPEDNERLGTCAYASPEQLGAPDQVDARSDIWSLGVVMFEALTGSLPVVEGWLGKRRLDFRPLESRSDVPGALRSLIRRCLMEDKAGRLGSAAALARALEPFCMQADTESPVRRNQRRPWRGEGRLGRTGLGARAGLWGDAHVLRSFPPPGRAPGRPRLVALTRRSSTPLC